MIKLLRYLFGRVKLETIDTGPKLKKVKEKTYMHMEKGTGRPYFTNEPPHIKEWCEKQIERNKRRCR